MDYKQNISVMIKGLLLLLLLSACSDEINTGAKLEPDSLDIIDVGKLIIYYISRKHCYHCQNRIKSMC